MNSYNVLLSGGSLKGAYTYGFFKELYRKCPDFHINKVYGVSVGSVNAIPIVTKKMDVLDDFWNHPEIHPFDTITQDWDSSNKTFRGRLHSYFKHGSFYKTLKREPFEIVLKDQEDLKLLRKKLIIITYDRFLNKPIFNRCTDQEKIIDAVIASTRFPGLFDSNGHRIIDGGYVDLLPILDKRKNEQWLFFDLQNKTKNMRQNFTQNIHVFSPKVAKIPIANVLSCVVNNRYTLDLLIDNGKQDASNFLLQHY
jgi:predicted acylesterase/phospholipase RssA